MEKISVMKSGLLIAAIVAFVSANAGLALDGKVFPGKGDKQTWVSACRIANDGVALAKAKKPDAALMKFQQAIAMYPHSDAFQREVGVTCEERAKPGDLKKAEAAYRKACELDPKDWKNWNALATVLSDQKRYKECKQACIRALNCSIPASEKEPLQKTIAEIDQYLLTHK
ncbi:MAG: tetratricopeptide repeat protein [Candidatus Obscuribacterales bacterium]|nr:tetratricopeptide repeat protein [Candidatus Obscuribacterales bacterium]